ncbi:major facilitator superfamily domain-containing protein [Clohesyomyces aquaticus]|uniref:Major facilitator superfamily domain-containing protein n=1 Tax=Clohesyomyces aquaticus TaxID=1231657 RepID=A0A1Y1YXT8_9PLEO|nr:major facilitator superfamily domain-containing protein [Clohesyomyces aquaticus]
MSDTSLHGEESDTFWAPGTVRLEHVHRSNTELVLHPVPTDDPDDPLNWGTARKTVNFGLVCFYVLWTFVQLDIGFTAWGPLQQELGLSVDQLNSGAAVNYAGLAVGCVLFIPFVHKYGRRPLYLSSSAVQLASVVWQGKANTFGDLLGSNIVSGLGGAISETVVQITIADVFFVHQHGTMNGWYLMFTSAGAFLGPVASGFVVESQGWRWMWWWCVIFMAVNLVLVAFLFEESKYIPVVNGRRVPQLSGTNTAGIDDELPKFAKNADKNERASLERTTSTITTAAKRKTYRERLALVTPSGGSITHHFSQPLVVMAFFPAVAYTALTYGIALASFAIMTSVQAVYLLQPPYKFGAVGVGLMNIAPFIGACLGFFVGGHISDKSIIWLSKRNRGVYEPEMRMWLAFIATLLLPAGILVFGLGLARGAHWPILALGFGIFGFGFVIATDISLTYTTDCYQEVIGDALVGVVFVRNVFSVIVLFALTPWINRMGVQNVHILTATIVLAVLLLPAPLLVWGKKIRIATAKRYRDMAMRQPTHRTLGEH